MVVMDQTPEGRTVRRRRRPAWFSSVPLLTISLVLYIALAAAGVDFAAPRFSIPLPSGRPWGVTVSDMVLTLSLFLLFVEILKATRTGGNSVVDHALSMVVFVVCLILFLVWQRAAESLFFLIMLMALIDVIAGFSVTITAARRDYSVGGDA